MAYKVLHRKNKIIGIIDYAIPNKRIREFEWDDVILYNEDKNISLPMWQDTLRLAVTEFDLDPEFNKCNTRK